MSIDSLICKPFLGEDFSFPTNKSIDCMDCKQVKEKRAVPEIKCCDIVPFFPNFRAGEILQLHPESAILRLIEERRGDPLGIHIPPLVAEKHLNARIDKKYGEGCPFLSLGSCSIYSSRPTPCQTYHCFYKDSLLREFTTCFEDWMQRVEKSLSMFLVQKSTLDLTEFLRFWDKKGEEYELWDGTMQKKEAYLVFWQHWAGREKQFYMDCYQKVLCLDKKDWFALVRREDSGLVVAKKPDTIVRKSYLFGQKRNGWVEMSEMESHLKWYIQGLSGKSDSLLSFQKLFSFWK